MLLTCPFRLALQGLAAGRVVSDNTNVSGMERFIRLTYLLCILVWNANMANATTARATMPHAAMSKGMSRVSEDHDKGKAGTAQLYGTETSSQPGSKLES